MQTDRVLRRLILALLFFAALPLIAQTQSGQLTGTVTQDKAGLPGVRVTVSSPALQGMRTAETDANGNFIFSALPPGQYTVTYELEGMQPQTRRVSVTLAGVSRADAQMRLSAVSETITVTAGTPSVVETNTVETNIQASTVENLPVLRNLLSTVDVAPGTTTNGPSGATIISGAPSFESTYYINGTPVNEVLRGQPLALFIEDAIQETTVLTGAISAEYGRFTGGVVNAISKSGGNDFSGSLRDSLTNPSWASTTPEKEDLLDKLSQTYEGTFGGRIVSDRLWFFTAGRYLDRSQQNFFRLSTNSYNTQNKQQRIEGKLTGQITPKQSIVGSILKLTADIQDRCLGAACFDAAALSQPEEQPQDLYSLNYNGVLTNSLLLEGFWSKSDLKFNGSGALAGDPYTATPNYHYPTGSISGSSQFCANCGEEVRESKNYGIKPHYFLSTPRSGAHNIVAGYEHYAESINGNNHQSGSDFVIYNAIAPVIGSGGEVLDRIRPNAAFILWWPILENAKPNDVATDGLYVNDKWDLNSRWSFNLGARFDKNDAKDSVGKVVANDSKFSPRLGVTFDTFGDGRLRLNGSYSEYVSKIANGNIADASSPAGSPSLLYWLYQGPTVTGATHDEFVKTVMDWFNSTGGTNNRHFLGDGGYLLGGGTNGISTQIVGSLKSPSVREIAFGASTQLGRNGYVRIDFQDRKWSDFYTTVLNLGTGTIFDPLIGSEIDRGIVTNGNDLSRKYRAAILQASYRFTPRLTVAGNYTYSTLKGNTTPETSNSGPVAESGSQYYPEIRNYAQNNPVGYLSQDQRHKVRAWASYDVPFPVGQLNVSVLERFDSGTPYEAVGTVDPIASGVPDPGYLNAAQASSGGFNYYFGPRGQYRWDNIVATDIGINFGLPLARLNFFVQGDIVNVFNRAAQIAGDTTVHTAYDADLQAFNPFTDKPVEGVNWTKDDAFGKPTGPGDYQQPRTYRLSLGFKF